MNTVTIQFLGKLMLKVEDLTLFSLYILISTAIAESLKEKMSTESTPDA